MKQLRPIATLILACACAGGCRLWRADGVSPVAKIEEAICDPQTLEALSVKLSKDLWQPNRSWSAMNVVLSSDTRRPTESMLRWRFGDPELDETLAKAEQLEPAAKTTSAAQTTDKRDEPNDSATAIEAEDAATATQDIKADSKSSPNSGDAKPAADANSELSGIKENWDGFSSIDVKEILERTETAEGQPHQQSGPGGLEMLARRDDLVGWNAAILWSRRDPSRARSAAPILEQLVMKPPHYERTESEKKDDAKPKPDDTKSAEEKKPPKRRVRISSRMQAAAAESLCLVLEAGSKDPVDGLAPVGRILESSSLDDAIRTEFYRGVAPYVPPNNIPRLDNALRESTDDRRAPVEIRRAAMDCCLIYALNHCSTAATPTPLPFDASSWPATILACRVDPDVAVRETFGRWLAIVRHPDAFEILKRQTADSEQRVREAALVSLGSIGSDEARNELRSHAESTKELVRAVALKGLGHWGVSELKRFVDDKSVHVRKTLARELGRHAQVDSALILQTLLLDASPQVQAAAVEAVEGWPNELALPILLQAISESSFATRRLGVQQFVKRTGLKDDFPFDGSPEVRAAAISKIAEEHRLPLGYFDSIRSRAPEREQKSNELHVSEVQSDLAALTSHQPRSPEYVAAFDRLTRLGVSDVPMIETWLATASAAGRSEIYREILPKISPVYRTLDDMKHPDVTIRRRGASQLAQIGNETSLSAHAVSILQERLAEEQDNLVWRYAMSSVFKDATEEVAQIAYMAVNHTWPDIREQGCLYIAQHGQPQHVPWLIPLLNDPNRAAQLAAIRAAGRCRNTLALDGVPTNAASSKPAGLRTLLTHPDRQIRFEAAVAMSRLGDQQGTQELVRLCSDQNAAVRETVVKEMGESGQTRFVEHLVRLGWTENNDRVQRAVLTSLELLTPPEKRPAGLLQESRNDAKIVLWNNWWQQHNRQGNQQWPTDTKISSSNGTEARL